MVRLMYALTMFMLKNNVEHGYELVLPPYLVNEKSLEVAGNFPKFKEQVYAIPEDKLFLTPTAEVNLSNLYRDKILPADQLPIRMTSWTSCFRREALSLHRQDSPQPLWTGRQARNGGQGQQATGHCACWTVPAPTTGHRPSAFSSSPGLREILLFRCAENRLPSNRCFCAEGFFVPRSPDLPFY